MSQTLQIEKCKLKSGNYNPLFLLRRLVKSIFVLGAAALLVVGCAIPAIAQTKRIVVVKVDGLP